jgi:hypothetical protein
VGRDLASVYFAADRTGAVGAVFVWGEDEGEVEV